jgi:hypothetical protein
MAINKEELLRKQLCQLQKEAQSRMEKMLNCLVKQKAVDLVSVSDDMREAHAVIAYLLEDAAEALRLLDIRVEQETKRIKKVMHL